LPDARVREAPDGRLLVRAGASEVAFSPLDLIHALAEQIPDKGQHLVRYYGAYANRARRLYATETEAGGPGGRPGPPPGEESEHAKARRKSWARLLRRILEVDPLLCPDCGAEMRIVAVITEHEVVDRILGHIEERDAKARAPPDPTARSGRLRCSGRRFLRRR
jgi:hypothetical protein